MGQHEVAHVQAEKQKSSPHTEGITDESGDSDTIVTTATEDDEDISIHCMEGQFALFSVIIVFLVTILKNHLLLGWVGCLGHGFPARFQYLLHYQFIPRL